uniref:RRM domain-containing protein n=1 Tax=Manihot esculenta TaxID=3983 RepID=A0A2C9WGI4_MANES
MLQEVQSLPETIQEEDPQNVNVEDDSGRQQQEPQEAEEQELEELEHGREDVEKEPEEEEEGEGRQPEEHHSHNLEVSSSEAAQSIPELAEADSTNEGASNGNQAIDEEENEDDESLEKLLEPLGKDQLVGLLRKSVDKYPDLIDSVREIADADPGHRKIFVHGLGWDTTAETLKSEFGKYGEIEDCKAVTDRVSGKSKGYAFILFKQRAGARKALRQPQKKIGNRITSCQLATAGPVPAPPPTTPAVSEYTQRKIFVSNVSAELAPEKLLEFFGQYGEIEEGPLGIDKQTGKPKGFALFVYKSVESAKKALEEPHKKFEGHTLHCQRAIDGPKSNKTGYAGAVHHQHHHHQPQYHHAAKKGKYSSGAHGPGHLMAPSGPSVNFSPGVASQGLNPALGQALTALGLGNLLGGLGGAPVNMGGPPAGYVNQAGGGYGIEPGMQGGYTNLQMNPHIGQSSAGRAQQGGPTYMGH